MKVELQIKETYKEEKLIVQAPQETKKVQAATFFPILLGYLPSLWYNR